MLLENQIKNIRHTRSSDQAKTYLIDDAQLTLNKLLAVQERELKEIDEQMVEEARHLNDFQASYQRLVDDFRESEVITKNAEQVIANAQASISRAQVLIQVNEQKLVAAKKRLEELEVSKKRVQEDLIARSSKLESLQALLSMKKFLSEEELGVQAWAEVERVRQHEIQRLRDQIHSLVEQD